MIFTSGKILPIVLVLFIMLQFFFIQADSNPMEPPAYPYVFIWTGESLYLPNETVLEFSKVYSDNSFILISTNYTLEKIFVTKITHDFDIQWELTLDNTSLTKYYIGTNIDGTSMIILLVEDTLDNALRLVLINLETGNIVTNLKLENLIGSYVGNYRDYYYENSVYISELNLLVFVLHPYYNTFTAVAVNLSSMNIAWSVVINHTASISIPRIWNNQLVLSLIRGTPLAGYNLTLIKINITNGSFFEQELIDNIEQYADTQPSLSPGSIIVSYFLGDHKYIMFVNTTLGSQYTIYLSSLGISSLESSKLYWDSRGEKFAVIGYNESGQNDILLVFTKDGDLIDAIGINGYVYMNSIKWSPDGKEIAFKYSALDSIYDKITVYNLSTGNSVLVRDIPLITVSTWDPDGKFYLCISPYTGPPIIIVFRHNETGSYEVESKTIVFHPYNVARLIVEKINDTIHIYFIDNVHYDNQHGYWDRVYIYHLVQEPVHILSRLGENSYLVGAFPPQYYTGSYSKQLDVDVDGSTANVSININAVYPVYAWKMIYNENTNEWDMTSIYYGTLLFIKSSSTLNTDSVSVQSDIYINISLNTSYRDLERLYSNITGVTVSLYENNGVLIVKYSYTPNIVARYKAINATIILTVLYSDNLRPVSPEELLEITINKVIYNERNTETTTTATTTTSEETTASTSHSTTQNEQYTTATQIGTPGENTQITQIQENKGNSMLIGLLILVVIATVLAIFILKK